MPEKITEKEIIVEVEKKVVEIQEKKVFLNKRKTLIVRITRPDGTIEEREEIIESNEGMLDISITDTTDSTKTKEKEVTKEYKRNDWLVQGMVGLSFKSKGLNENYGGSVSRRIIGPIYLGAYGFSDRRVGLSVGFEF
jgi:hypothetical protein